MTTEPFNLTGKNTFKFSGLANEKAVSIAPQGKGFVLATKSKKDRRSKKPSAATNTSAIKNRNFRSVAKSIKKVVGESGYRSDLTQTALAKFSLLHRASKNFSA